MKAELKSLYDKKGKIVNEMNDAFHLVKTRTGADAGKPTKEERTKFDNWDKELEEVQEKIDFELRAAKHELEKEARAGVELESDNHKEKKFNDAATAVERREATNKAKKYGYTALSDDERVIVDTDRRDVKVFEKFLRGQQMDAEELRVMNSYREKRLGTGQSLTTTAGGYTVPEGFAGRIVEYMVLVSQLLNWASILRTSTGNTIPFPINDDNSNTGELIGENADLSTSSADLVFSVYNLGAYKMSSKMVTVSSELAQDNGVNLVDYLAKRLGIRTGKIANYHYTVGSGTSQPKGFLQTRGGVTSSTSTFTLAEMSTFQDSIDPAYRDGANTAWSMHSAILSEIKALSIASTAYGQVWSPSFRDGQPDTILGKRYFLNQAMSSTSATGDKIMAYGDWSKFNIRIVNDITLKVLSERYAEFDKSAYVALMRTDSFLEDTTAVKYLDIS
jgi:HK97 family phage major capsid protein